MVSWMPVFVGMTHIVSCRDRRNRPTARKHRHVVGLLVVDDREPHDRLGQERHVGQLDAELVEIVVEVQQQFISPRQQRIPGEQRFGRTAVGRRRRRS